MSTSDPFAIWKDIWKNAGFDMPAFMTPTLDVDEISSRIKDLREVENWLRMNLNMLQITIQSLEVQHIALTSIRSVVGSKHETTQTENEGAATNPFSAFMSNPSTNPAMWPWLNPSLTVPDNLAGSFKSEGHPKEDKSHQAPATQTPATKKATRSKSKAPKKSS